jgi:hypothetical protein
MKHNKSAFPFKSPVKQNERAIQEGVPGHAPRTTTPHTANLYSNEGAAEFYRKYQAMSASRVGESPTPTPEEYEAQGLNRYGGTDMSI